MRSNTRKLILTLITNAVLSGCGAYHDQQATVSGGSQINTFAATIRPILQSNCFGCHANPGGSAGSAFFMNPNDNTQLYNDALRRITPGSPNSSLLLNKATGGMGHSPGNQLPNVADQDRIKAWINSETVSGTGTGTGTGAGTGTGTGTGTGIPSNLLMTARQSIPSNLSLNGSYQVVRFPLNIVAHNGAFVEMGIRFYTDGGYEYSQWRVYSPNYPIKVTGLNILVTNGTRQDFSNTLSSEILTAPKSGANDSATTPLPGTVLSSRAATGIVLATGDLIQLGFRTVERTDILVPPSNQEQMFFLASVKPILLNNCASCHGNASGSGNFNMPNNDDQILYQNVRARVTARDPNNSKLYLKGTGGSGHGGGNRLPNQADRDTISNWINMIQ